MALPKVNTPTYELKIPSTGQKVSYRPFLVKEEKLLLMAIEDGSVSAMSKAIDEYKDLSTDLVNEIDPLDELNEDKESIDSSIEDYLDEEVINALDKNIKFI